MKLNLEYGGAGVQNRVEIFYYNEEIGDWITLGKSTYEDKNTITYQISNNILGQEGYYDFKFVLEDEDGNTTEEINTYFFDLTPPETPENVEANMLDGVVALSWDTSKSKNCVSYYILKSEVGSGQYNRITEVQGRENTYYVDADVAEGKEYSYMLQAKDEFGRRSVLSKDAVILIEKDTKAPVINSIMPEAESISRNTEIIVSAKDNKSLAKIRMEYKQNEQEEWILLEEKETEEKAGFAITNADIKEGKVTIRAIAVDTAGNQSDSFEKTYILDETGPEKIIINSCEADSTTVHITWEYPEDEDFSYCVIEQLLNDGSYLEIGKEEKSLGFSITDLQLETEYTFRVVGYDFCGNRGVESDPFTVKTEADTLAPVLMNVYPQMRGYNQSMVLGAEVSDNVGVDYVKFTYSLDGENFVDIAEVQAKNKGKKELVSYEFSLEQFPEGNITIGYEAFDIFGNSNYNPDMDSDIFTVTYPIDRTAPSQVKGFMVDSSAYVVGLKWDKNTEEDVEGYVLYKASGENGTFEKITTINSLYYQDVNVKVGETYKYKVAAIDWAGNISASSVPVVCVVTPDTVKPIIAGVSPKDNHYLGMSPNITVYVYDNAGINNIDIQYQKKDDKEKSWYSLDRYESKKSENSVEFNPVWDTTDLDEGTYIVKVCTTDISGNVSEEVYREYQLDLTKPKQPALETAALSYAVGLSYSESEDEDFSHYEIYKKEVGTKREQLITSTTETSFTDTEIELGNLYEYSVKSVDKNGNFSRSRLSDGYGSSVDTIAPIPAISPIAQGIVGYPVLFDGLSSTDNDVIKSYVWKTGDGKTLKGPCVNYTYKKAGTYRVALTVTDRAGNTATKFGAVEVIDPDGKGKTKVRVKGTDASNISEASVYIKLPDDGGFKEYICDENGKATICMEPGVYEYAAYKQGCTPTSGTIKITLTEVAEKVIILDKTPPIAIDLTTRKLSIEEMIANGVDLSDPENKMKVTVGIKVTLYKTLLPAYNGSFNSSGVIDYNKFTGGSGGSSGDGGGGTGQGISSTPSYGLTGIKIGTSVIDGRQFYYSVATRQSISWLKDMFEVDMTVYNIADSEFVIQNGTATLELPKGLSLAKTKTPQNLEQKLPEIAGRKKESCSWMIKGDDPGNYKLGVVFKGSYAPINAPIEFRQEVESSINATAGAGIHIYIYPEDAAYIGDNYYIQFRVTNASKKTFYDFRTTFGAYREPPQKKVIVIKDSETNQVIQRIIEGGGKDYVIPEASKCAQIPVVVNGDTININAFEPGKSLYGTFSAPVTGYGEDTFYYTYLNEFIEMLEGSNLGVKVHVATIPSHVDKSVAKVYNKKTKSTGTNTDTGNNEENEHGDPVDVTSGAFTENITALSLSGGATLSFDLSYNSLLTDEKGELGYGWMHSYEAKLKQRGNAIMLYTSPSNFSTFISQDALNGCAYGIMADNEIGLDDKEYFGVYVPISKNMNGYFIERSEDGTYKLSEKDGTVYVFNQSGKLKSITNPQGKKVTFTYDGNKMIAMDSASDRVLIMTYNGEDLIKQVDDGNGRKAVFTYSADGKYLTQITFPDNTIRKFKYDNGKLVKEIGNSDNVFVENTYDDTGRVLTQIENGSSVPTKFSYSDEEDDRTSILISDHLKNKTEIVTDKNQNIIYSIDAIGSLTKYTYDKEGNQLTQTDHNNNKVMYEYLDGDMISSTDVLGTTLTYGNDSRGNITHIEDADGNFSRYEYNDQNRITYSKTFLGEITTYTYDSKGYMKTETIEGKGTKKYTYTKGQLAKLVDCNGNQFNYTYDAAGDVFRMEVYDKNDKLLRSTHYTYDKMRRVTSVQTGNDKVTYKYDKNGNIKSITDGNDNQTNYVYDDAGNLLKETNALNETTTHSYDAMGNLKKTTFPDGTKELYTYDAVGNLTKLVNRDKTECHYEYDALSNKIYEKGPNGQKIHYTYYPNGVLQSERYDNGPHYTYYYDKYWRLQQKTDIANNVETYTRDSAGNITSIKDPVGNKTIHTYDIHSNLVQTKDPMGNITKYEYDGNGNCIAVIDALGVKTSFIYNPFGQVLSQTRHTDKGDLTKSYQYDEKGNITASYDELGNFTKAVYDPNNNVASLYDETGKQIQSNTYDALNRVISSMDVNDTITEYTYNTIGDLQKTVSYKDTKSEVISNLTYDKSHNLLSVTNTDGQNSTSVTSSYEYNAIGSITKQTNPEEGTIAYTYNGLGQVLTEKIGTNAQAEYCYNALGLLESKKNSNNNATTYTYDAAGRITSQRDDAGTIKYEYDKNSNIIKVTDQNGSITRTYDALNRVLTCTDYKNRTVSYTYDQAGNRVTVTYPGNKTVKYTYTKTGLLETVTDSDNKVTAYAHDKAGRLLETRNANGTKELRTYNQRGQLYELSITIPNEKTYKYNYTYDEKGNIVHIAGTENKAKEPIANIQMTYDKNDRLKTYNGKAITYDQNGNMTYGPLEGVMTSFTYDCRNRLIKAGNHQYEYDAENNRIATIIDNKQREEYILDRELSLAQVIQTIVYEPNFIGLLSKEVKTITYTHGKGLISQVSTETGYRQYHFDHLGSTIATTNQNAKKQTEYQYGPYGELLETTNLTAMPDDTRYLYNGKYGVSTDKNGLYYMRARYYNVSIKRFINQDIITGNITNSQSLNRYSYVQGNPINLIDPFGLSPDLPGGGGGGGGENSPEQKVSKWEWLHLGLDIAGFIPALGLVPDLINAVIYAVEGDSTNAALSAAAAIPFVGDVVGGSKLGLKAGRLLSKGTRNSKVIQKVVKYTSNASEFAIKAGKAGLDTANRAFQSVKVTAKAIITEGKIAKSGNNLRKIVKNSKVGKAASKVWGKVAKKGGSVANQNYDLYRKIQNTGELNQLDEVMQLKNVKKLAKDAEIGIDGINIKIDRNPELLGRGLYGHTDGTTITLYPDAFTDTETLIKTLGHERMHVYQVSVFGRPTSSGIAGAFEKAASSSEKSWWDYFKLKNGGR